jgi:molybdenum cofactor cytidylyltransferase
MGGIGVVVLAAGAGSRFGGGKLLAELEGRPILGHVLDAIDALSPSCCVVVLGADGPAIGTRIRWRDEIRVTNPTPAAGLASSLRLGVATCLEAQPDASGVIVVLGDQPRTSPDVMRALIAAVPAALRAGAWAVVPRYALGGGANPALLLPAACALVPELEGDRGMRDLLTADRARVVVVDVPGANPDVDTPADLEALAEASGQPAGEAAGDWETAGEAGAGALAWLDGPGADEPGADGPGVGEPVPGDPDGAADGEGTTMSRSSQA